MNFRPYSILLVFLVLFACKNNAHITSSPSEINGKRFPIDNTISPDPEIEDFIRPYSNHLNATLDSTLAYNPRNLNKSDGKLNTAIGNMMADLVMAQANPIFKSRTGFEIDMVLLNHGGIRSGIGEGAVTTRTGFKLMPFENEIVVAELSGKKMLELLNYLENAKIAHPISGLELKVDGNFKTISALIREEPINTEKTYFVATSDYLQQGGDSMNFFKNPSNLYKLDYKLRNAIIDHFKKVDTLKTSIDNRYIQIL
ncbi:5'-nucleotidase C-terminal domain-containing protein [Gillisia marina]|uniref:5'-nucleotidase C-terminal domain-containing protein n=1 Tax=Gillisia marina TaxID=1167637 RepID=UPI00029ACD41|nr:5'-nucleotidase C-terminal domain-containing protein [Gillisia marina]